MSGRMKKWGKTSKGRVGGVRKSKEHLKNLYTGGWVGK